MPAIDLQTFAEEHEDKMFNLEMEQLQPELEKLEEGKSTEDIDSSCELYLNPPCHGILTCINRAISLTLTSLTTLSLSPNLS